MFVANIRKRMRESTERIGVTCEKNKKSVLLILVLYLSDKTFDYEKNITSTIRTDKSS